MGEVEGVTRYRGWGGRGELGGIGSEEIEGVGR